MHKKILSIIITCLLVIGIFIPISNADDRTWWNVDWNYYKIINIADPINDYQIKINVSYISGGDVNCNGHCNTNFSDIRFIDFDNVTVLDYWNEKIVDGSYAWFWVELPSDIETDDKIKLYYGNLNASSISNGTDTFYYFEDWTDNNTADWLETRQSDNKKTLYTLQNNDTGYNTRFVWKTKWNLWDTGSVGGSICFGFIPNNGSDGDYNYDDIKSGSAPETGSGASSTIYSERLDSVVNGITHPFPYIYIHINPFSLGEYYIRELLVSSNNVKISIFNNNRDLISSYNNDNVTDETNLSYFLIGLWDQDESGHHQYFIHNNTGHLELYCKRGSWTEEIQLVDWMFLSKYNETEPYISSVSNEIPQSYDVTVYLKIGWNLIGWFNNETTMASSIAENISGCLSVSGWDNDIQSYKTYITGGPPSFDFPVYIGHGLFVDVTMDSEWHGEG
jgi:hypothetical protein